MRLSVAGADAEQMRVYLWRATASSLPVMLTLMDGTTNSENMIRVKKGKSHLTLHIYKDGGTSSVSTGQ